MSVTIVNKALYDHEEAMMAALESYHYTHPAYSSIIEEYDVPVPGGAEFHMSEWAIMSIWNTLQEHGWPESLPMFPAIGMKRVMLLAALKYLLDVAVAEAMPNKQLLDTASSMQSAERVVAFNTQTSCEALEGMIAFLEKHQEVYSL